jgi:hypothetical protein
MFATAAVSFADCRERSRLGIAIVAIIRMIATTINSSSNENPRLVFTLSPRVIKPHLSRIDENKGWKSLKDGKGDTEGISLPD